MGIGLPTPRPALRLVKTAGDTRVRFSQDLDKDLTDKMHHFAEEVLPGVRISPALLSVQNPKLRDGAGTAV
jgi:uncharacterized protein YbbK (DUF523 family)